MLYMLEIIFILLLSVLWWYRNDRRKYAKHPPGPTRIPFFGSSIQLLLRTTRSNTLPAIAYKKLADIYGDVMFLKLGKHETVVFTSHDAIHEILVSSKTTGRTQFEAIRDRHNDKNLGIIWGHGQSWQTLRRFTVRNLKVNKIRELDVVVNDELIKFVDHIKLETSQEKGNVVHVEDLFNLTMLNVLWRLVSGQSYDYKDEKMLRLLKLNDDFVRSTNFGLDITHVFPSLREWFPDWAGKTIQKSTASVLFDYGKELLYERMQVAAKSDAEECFIDLFAAKIKESENDPETHFTDEQFVMTILDLMVGGSETSSKTLTFGILYMLLNPRVQEKVQQEIDREIPYGTPISTEMKSRLPYTSATVLEILRYSTILPTPSAREATEDFNFRGFLIRKGTSLMTNVHAVHYNATLWGDPENFRPERFLNSSGTAVEKKTANLLASFGAGRRFCMGQSLAETTIFIYFATMLRNFNFIKVPGTNPTVEPMLGITSYPHPFDVQIVARTTPRRSDFA